MPRKGHTPEQVLNRFRQVDVGVANGKSVGQARKLKKLEQENARLKRAVANVGLQQL